MRKRLQVLFSLVMRVRSVRSVWRLAFMLVRAFCLGIGSETEVCVSSIVLFSVFHGTGFVLMFGFRGFASYIFIFGG